MTVPAWSLILTVRDEAASLPALLASIAAQRVPPDEIVVVDGGSRDQTVAILEAWRARLPLRIEILPGAGISAGRNRAAALATYDLLLVTDGGVVLDPGWAAALLDGFGHPGAVAVAGFFRADPHTLFEAALGATILPLEEEVDPRRFLPSSRSFAVRRQAFLEAGGYPEWLDYCEDLLLDFALIREAGPPAWRPGAIAWFRPRPDLRSFMLQYFRYARGDGKAGLFTRRHLIRYGTYGIAVLFLVAAPFTAGLSLLPLLAGGLAYCRRPWLRLGQLPLGWRDRLLAASLVPLIRLAGDAAKMAGYPAGLAWRLWRRGRLAT